MICLILPIYSERKNSWCSAPCRPALTSCPFLSLPPRLSPCLLVAPVVSDGAPRCAIHHLLASLATSVPMAFVLVGGMVQGATPTWFLTGWMAFRRNPGAHWVLPRLQPPSVSSIFPCSASATIWDMARAMMISYGWYRHALEQSRHLWVLIWILPHFFELFWSRSYFSGSVLGWSFLMSDNQGSFTLVRTYWSGDGDTRGRVMIEQRRIWAHSNAVLVSSTVCYVFAVLYLYLAPLWFVHFHNNSFKSLLLFETAVF